MSLSGETIWLFKDWQFLSISRQDTLWCEMSLRQCQTNAVSNYFLEMILFPQIVEFNYTDMATIIKQNNSGGHGKRHQK